MGRSCENYLEYHPLHMVNCTSLDDHCVLQTRNKTTQFRGSCRDVSADDQVLIAHATFVDALNDGEAALLMRTLYSPFERRPAARYLSHPITFTAVRWSLKSCGKGLLR